MEQKVIKNELISLIFHPPNMVGNSFFEKISLSSH
jgi:hypothetical protein